MKHPFIFDIKRHSLEDGPGIRSVVFFKGCPLRCVFCHNPESRNPSQEILYSDMQCIKCKSCVSACSAKAITFSDHLKIDYSRCNYCGRCVSACPGNGLRLIGKKHTAEQLMEILLRDKIYYEKSGGGVTFSGGECLLYPEYLHEIIAGLKSEQIHVAIQTSGYFLYDECCSLFNLIDIIYFDIKFTDPLEHLKHTGKSNDVIVRNLSRLADSFRTRIIPRMPLIPELTTTEQNISGIVALVKSLEFKNFAVVPYNPLGSDRKGTAGRGRGLEQFMSIDQEHSIVEKIGKLL